MILGTGIDLVEIDRFRDVLNRAGERFCARVYTPAELAGRPAGEGGVRYLAARFAAKEAVLKAMGTGLRGGRFTDIEITRDDAGKPGVVLNGGLAGAAAARGITGFLISLSHERNYAVAHALALGGNSEGRSG